MTPEGAIRQNIATGEQHDISTMPVVERGIVQGMIGADLSARRSPLRLLQSQLEDAHLDQGDQQANEEEQAEHKGQRERKKSAGLKGA